MGEGVFATVDHSDIRGSKPHSREPLSRANSAKELFNRTVNEHPTEVKAHF